MADNFLEKQYENWKQGTRQSVRRTSPSLESLLESIAAPDKPADTTFILKQAQLDAIARAVRKVPGAQSLEIDSSEADGTLEIRCADSALLGAAALVARMKAAELHLKARVVELPGSVELNIYR